MSDLFRQLNNLLGANQKRTTQFNGGQERTWQVMKQLMSTIVSYDQSDWDELVPFVMLCLNQSWHAATNFLPARLFLGREIMTPTKLLLPLATPVPAPEGQYPARMEATMHKVWAMARERMAASAEASELYYDKNVVPANIDVGDQGFMHVLAGKVGLARKLRKRFSGPWVVTKVNE